MLNLATYLRCSLLGSRDVCANPIYIALKLGPRKHVGREIAVAALRAAEGDRDVDTERQTFIIPSGLSHRSKWSPDAFLSCPNSLWRVRSFRVLIRRMKPKLPYLLAVFVVTCFAQTLVERTFVMRAETTTVDPGTGMNSTCVLVYPDGKYRMERTFRGMTGSSSDINTKVFLDTLPEADLKALGAVLDDSKFIAIKTGELSPDKIGKDMDTLLVSVPREHAMQNIAFNNAAERTPFEKDLKPFLNFFKNLQKRKAPVAKGEKSNNCEPPAAMYGSAAPASKEEPK